MSKPEARTLLSTIKRLSRHESLTGNVVDGKAFVRAFDKAKEKAK
jgi:hypothetical protein